MRNHCFPAIANIIFCLVLLLTGCDKNQPQPDIPDSDKADLVVYGNIYTAEYSADGKSTTAEAIAIKDGKFEYVGSADGVKGYISNKSEEYLADVDKAVRLRNEYSTVHVRANNIKLFVDGLVETGHGYIKQPYSGIYADLGNGKPAWTAEQMKEIVTAANAKGEGVHCHVMGDLAASITIDAFAAGYNKDVRNSMCHLRNINAPDYQKMAEKCNVACSGAMNWHAGDPAMIELLKGQGIPEKYAKESYPMKSFFDAGVCFVNSSDRPCDAGNFYPFGCMQVGVTCKSVSVPEESEWWPEEKLSREQALQAMTINGAYLAQNENVRGSITKGKWADFIVVDQDVLSCPAMEIAGTKVLKTYFEGKQVY